MISLRIELKMFAIGLTLFFLSLNIALGATTDILRPIADGGEDGAQWTSNTAGTTCNAADCYLDVDETAGARCTNSDGDTSYIESDLTGEVQTFDIDESSVPDGYSISNITVTACYKKGAGVLGNFQIRRCVNGSCVSSGVPIVQASAYVESSQSFDIVLTKDASTDIEIGIENTANAFLRISQISAILTYSDADVQAPNAVTDLAAAQLGDDTISLSWTATGDDLGNGTASTYDIRYSTTNITNDTEFNSAIQVSGEPTPSVAGTSESMTVSGLTNGQTYYFAMKVSDEVPNTSSLSNSSSALVDDVTAPGTVTNLNASPSTVDTINLTWTATGDDGSIGTATTYDIRYSTSNITNSTEFDAATQVSGEPSPSTSGTSESFDVTSLTSGQTYYFAMKVIDNNGNGTLSNTDSVTVENDTSAPCTISSLSSSNQTTSSVTLTWTSPGDDSDCGGTASSYEIRYSREPITETNWDSATQVSGEPDPEISGTAQSYAVTGLNYTDTTYYFAIKSIDEQGNTSALSNVLSQKTSFDQTDTRTAGDTVDPTTVIFSGLAYPESNIEILRRSAIEEAYRHIPIESSDIRADGSFELIVQALLQGEYFFALRFIDKDGSQTGIVPFSINFFRQNELIVRDILAPPTIGFKEQSVPKNSTATVIGYSSPKSKVKIEFDENKIEEAVYVKMGLESNAIGEATADENGFYSFDINTTNLDIGDYFIRASQKATDSRVSDFSLITSFRVSGLTLPKADFNNDNKVNITDWSVFLFRWGSDNQELRNKIDMNGDGNVDIADFSVFLREFKM